MRAPILSVAATALVAAVLICVYVVAARPPQELPIPKLPVIVILLAWTVLVLALLAAIGAAAAQWLRRRRRRTELAEKGFSIWSLAAISVGGMVLTLGAAALVMSFLRPPPQEPAQAAPPAIRPPTEEPQLQQETGQTPRSPSIDPKTVGLILLAIVGASAFLLLAILIARRVNEARGRLVTDEEELEVLRRELAAGLRVGIEEILAEADYRRAVIACYRRMEQSFASSGFPRTAPEAPLEYLERVVRGAAVAPDNPRVRQALATLTRLYEIARFSEHAMLPKDRADAVGSLRILETALSSPAALTARP